jgi:hypothetical protein
MAVTPKVKMQLQPSDIKAALGIPAEVELLSVVVNCDPLAITLLLSSEDEFDDLYAPLGGFEPSISYETIPRTFFNP